MKSFICTLCSLLVLTLLAEAQDGTQLSAKKHRELIEKAETILFLGDSITFTGHYVVNIDTWLTLTYPQRQFSVINQGLPSETVSGLSEKGHAKGKFPRPYLHERLHRVLTKTKPDLVFACYGMNCGIYKPFHEARFQKYKNGILKLKSETEKAGAKIIFITPPLYDSNVDKSKSYYTEVLARYSSWLVSQRKNGWHVIDLNTHMTKALAKKRKSHPQFTYQKDAVHPDAAGHWVMTQPILNWLGDPQSADCANALEMTKKLGGSQKFYNLITTRSELLRNAWLTDTGHKRPGIEKGLPINQATQKATVLTQSIEKLKHHMKSIR